MKIKKENGVTMLILVVMIIVLLILAGVTIASSIGNNGILNKATESSRFASDASVREALMTLQVPYTNMGDYMNFLRDNQYIIKDTNTVDVKKVLGLSETTYGTGTENQNVYKIEQGQEGNNCYVYYYDKNQNKEKIADLSIK